MKRKIGIVFFIFLLLGIYLYTNKNDNKNELKENVRNRAQYAVYVQKSDLSGYEKYSQNGLPSSGYDINIEKSVCVDNNGDKVTGVLSTNGNKIVLTSNKTVFCDLYYDVSGPKSGLEILATSPANLSSELVGGMYRFQGTKDQVTNNYITLKDGLFRIIGITETGELYVVKKEALESATVWDNGTTAQPFPNSQAYTNLSTNFNATSIYTVGNGTYPVVLKNWKYGTTTKSSSASDYYTDYSNWSSTSSYEFSIMYPHDYAYAYIEETPELGEIGGVIELPGEIDLTDAVKSWIALVNNDDNPPSNSEYLNALTSDNKVFNATNHGIINTCNMTSVLSIRPTFYLTNNIRYTGNGTLANPYKIAPGVIQ